MNLLQAAMNLLIVIFRICDSQQAKKQKPDHSFFVVLTQLGLNKLIEQII